MSKIKETSLLHIFSHPILLNSYFKARPNVEALCEWQKEVWTRNEKLDQKDWASLEGKKTEFERSCWN